MTDLIINADILPEPLFSLVKTEKMRVLENDGAVELHGVNSDGKLTLDKFLEWKHVDKELEQRR